MCHVPPPFPLPSQVRETSRFSLWNPRSWGLAKANKSSEEIKRDFSDIILPAALHTNVRMLAAAGANTKRHGAPFRHILFYGTGEGGEGEGGQIG